MITQKHRSNKSYSIQKMKNFPNSLNQKTNNNKTITLPPNNSMINSNNSQASSTFTRSTNNTTTIINTYINCRNNKPSKSQEIAKKKYVSPNKKIKQDIRPKLFNLSQEMERRRQSDLQIINKKIPLLNLFMIAYTSSQIIATNLFQIKSKTYPRFGIDFLGLLLTIYEGLRRQDLQQKLKRLSLNLLKMAPTASEFQRKIEFVSRRVVLNSQKGKQIEMSFINPEIESFWQWAMSKVLITNQLQYYQEMFDLEAQKLCFNNFQALTQGFLSTSYFQQALKQTETRRNEDSNEHSFTLQFQLIQMLCTGDYRERKIEAPQYLKISKLNSCELY